MALVPPAKYLLFSIFSSFSLKVHPESLSNNETGEGQIDGEEF